MNYTDFNSFFDKQKADIGILSTYDFDPLYFEHRLLRSNALRQARRIIVFMDRGRYLSLLKNDNYARYINQRYLVVPIYKPGGVFHAKLTLLINQDGAWVLCGSNNLTQAGCTHNLEFINAIRITIGKDDFLPPNASLIADSLSFYTSCLELSSGTEQRLAKQWLSELHIDVPWLSTEIARSQSQYEPKIVHTLKASLWDWLLTRLGDRSPSKVMIVSPFYDPDLRLLKKVKQTWPKCKIEIIAQQQTSNLPVKKLKEIDGKARLFSLEGAGGRRLHAKLLAIYTDDVAICLVGSANFTSAAIGGANVETCLGLEISAEKLDELFDKELWKKPIKINDFEPGKQYEPVPEEADSGSLMLSNASLDAHGKLCIQYQIRSKSLPESLAVAIQSYGEEKPSQSIPIPLKSGGEFITPLENEVISGFRGATRCYMIGTIDSSRETSPPCWLIQETRLTHEPSDGTGKPRLERRIRETGQGLTDYLNHLLHDEGPQAVIEYLNNLNIRYHDDSRFIKRGGGSPTFHDPTRSDRTPNWILEISNKDDLEKTIYDFVDRHQKNVFRRHAYKGNINGLNNFLDVFIEINKLLYTYYRQGILKPLWAMQKINRNIGIFTLGVEDIDWVSEGFITKMTVLHSGDITLLRDALKEREVPGHLRAALLFAQIIRWEDDSKKQASPANYLARWLERIKSSLAALGLKNIDSDQVGAALDEYQILDEVEIKHWLSLLT